MTENKRAKGMTDKNQVFAPTHLIMVNNIQTHKLRVVCACSCEYEANTVFANLSGLFHGTPNVVHQVPLPDAPGFVETAVVSSDVPEISPPTKTLGNGARWTAPAEELQKPAPFRRMSQAEFQAETQAMMGQEEGSLQWRDADDPISEGGAIS